MTKKQSKVDLVKERCVLVFFSAGYYNWLRRDKKAEREYADSKGIRKDAYETKKNLFVGADQLLTQVKSLVNEVRAYHYDVTLPWQHGHSAALANGLVPSYREKIAGFQNRMDQLNDAIKIEWKGMINNAKRILGPAFYSNDYPPVEKVLAANYIKAKYAPVGTGSDIRSTVDVDEEIMEEIRDEVNADTVAAYDAAIKALWERLFEVLKVANKNLQKINSDDGRFRTEWYDNLTSLLPTLDHLNLSGDPRIAKIKQQAEKLLEYDADDLKESVNTRAAVAKEADKVFQQVSGIFATFGGDE
jgi:hypothetical protein